MKLYTTSTSLSGRRVAIFLAEKGLCFDEDIEKIEIDLSGGENLGPSFKAMNPYGRVPVLELGSGTHIAETVAISRYIENMQSEPPLFGVDAMSQAMVEMWNRRAELSLLLPVTQAFRNISGFFKDREKVLPTWGHLSAEMARSTVPLFDDRLGESQFLAGDYFSIADITLVATLDFARAVKQDLPYDLPNLDRWYQEVSSRPSCQDP